VTQDARGIPTRRSACPVANRTTAPASTESRSYLHSSRHDRRPDRSYSWAAMRGHALENRSASVTIVHSFRAGRPPLPARRQPAVADRSSPGW
jgi:hypothetical protein